jgi:hypothetical protein
MKKEWVYPPSFRNLKLQLQFLGILKLFRILRKILFYQASN